MSWRRRTSLLRRASSSSVLRPNSRAMPSRSVSQRARSPASRRTWYIISFRGRVLMQRSTLPIARPLQHLRIDLEEHDHAAGRPEVAHVVEHGIGKLHDRSRGHHHLLAADVHVGDALEDVDGLLLLGMLVHHGRLPWLVAGDLRPELVGLDEHLAHPLVGREVFERVEIEELRDPLHRGHCRLVHELASLPRARIIAPSRPSGHQHSAEKGSSWARTWTPTTRTAGGREGSRCEAASEGRTRGVVLPRRACGRGCPPFELSGGPADARRELSRSRWALIGRLPRS